MKHGEPKEEDFEILNQSLLNLDYQWAQAGMIYTPKIHGVLSHAAEQVQRLGGIGDPLVRRDSYEQGDACNQVALRLYPLEM
jgi:hypothetical protein